MDTSTDTKVLRGHNPVEDIFCSLGHYGVRRSYRMHSESFCNLHQILFITDEEYKLKRGVANDKITKIMRLNMALRWMTACDKLDIAPHHGVGLREVMESVWQVVDLVNNCEKLKIKFPATHEEQLKNTDGFKEKSKSGFDTCVGCIDDILVCTEKPSMKDKLGGKVRSAKIFFCGRNLEWYFKLFVIIISHLLMPTLFNLRQLQ